MLGSVFLGDPRSRLIASSSQSPPQSPSFFAQPPHITPEVALQLRIRWLEALLLGVSEMGGQGVPKPSDKVEGRAKGKREEKKVRIERPSRGLRRGDAQQ
ncbi:16068_t:CDS:1, partial [Acaulospora colombiana]